MDKLNITGHIMSKDSIVADIKDNVITDIDYIRAPIYLARTRNLDEWLRHRSIDTHRTHSRLLRKILRLQTIDEIKLVMHVHAKTITDTFWIKPLNSTLNYKDVSFTSDYLSDAALTGSFDAMYSSPDKTPELTNTGSYEKCWKLINDHWYMLKRGNTNELYSELFTYNLGKALNFDMAQYMLQDKHIMTRDFTDNAAVNFEPMFSLMDDNEDYLDNLIELKKLSPTLLQSYLDIIFLDTIVMNVDRHTFNYGLLRDPITGTILKLAPNFDNNLSLIARGYPSRTDRNDLLVSLFKDILPKVNYKLPCVDKDLIYSVASKTAANFEDEFDLDFITKFCYNAYKNIQN